VGTLCVDMPGKDI